MGEIITLHYYIQLKGTVCDSNYCHTQILPNLQEPEEKGIIGLIVQLKYQQGLYLFMHCLLYYNRIYILNNITNR